MHKFSQEAFLPFSVEQIFDMIIDIDKYSEFLPWCSASRVVEKGEEQIIADLMIKFSIFSESYRSKVSFTKQNNSYASIDVEMIEGPFKYLSNFWRIKKTNSGCEVDVSVDFEFKSAILNKTMGSIFQSASEDMMQAFTKRAEELYGSQQN